MKKKTKFSEKKETLTSTLHGVSGLWGKSDSGPTFSRHLKLEGDVVRSVVPVNSPVEEVERRELLGGPRESIRVLQGLRKETVESSD